MTGISAHLQKNWRVINTRFEGCVDHMYPDIRGLVTTGMGNLIDPVTRATTLPWMHRSDDTPAILAEIEAEWGKMHGNDDLARRGAGAAARVATLYLGDDAIDDLITRRFSANIVLLMEHPAFADIQSWPEPAQTALCSMAWAMGPSFGPHWPRFSAACAAKDWVGAAQNCWMDDRHNPGLTPRNAFNRQCFLGAVI